MAFNSRKALVAALFTSTALAAPALAQEAAPEESGYDEILVTAQKREENLQNVPISIQAIGTERLEDLNITDFKGYAQQLPNVSFLALGGTPGTNVIYMRGVAATSSAEGNHSGTLPSVGVYLDEQPVTTIGGNLDVHIYDIARIESLAGPQGTLYGASSQAGTIRIITNQPSTAGFEGSMDIEANQIDGGKLGGTLDAMINAPLGDSAALRVTGFYQRDGGFIDNVAGQRCFVPQPGGICVRNTALVEENFNDVEVYGGRAALKIDLDDTWTMTPSVMYQHTETSGAFGYDPSVGDLKTQRFFDEFRTDKFVQAALTIEGQLGNWDVTYAGAYLDRRTNAQNDYTDYSEAYDSLYSSVGGLSGYFYYTDALGNTLDPRQRVISTDHFTKMSHEVRVASPSADRFRVVAGAFYQRQSNDIYQDYKIKDLGPLVSVNGQAGTLWLTKQERIDRDYAMFGEASFDLTDTITLTAGVRGFIFHNTLIGFFGFGRNPGNGFSDGPPNAAGSNRTGVAQCFTRAGDRLYDRDSDTYSSSRVLLPPAVDGSPCTNLGVYSAITGAVEPVKSVGSGVTYRFNAQWKPSSDVMLYATASRGYRPGGINRRADVAPYAPDYLINYELGWKTSPAPGLRFNGAVFQQNWNTFQFAFLGENSFTEIHNGPDARIRGVEFDLGYNTGGLNLNVAGAYTDARTQQNLCSFDDPTYACTAAGNSVAAPTGTRLPVTPKWKLSGTARYTVESGSAKYYGQINAAYQGSASSDIRVGPAAVVGRLPAFTVANLAIGAEWDSFDIELFVSNLFDERGQLSRFVACGLCSRAYIVPTQPRTIGVRAGIEF